MGTLFLLFIYLFIIFGGLELGLSTEKSNPILGGMITQLACFHN